VLDRLQRVHQQLQPVSESESHTPVHVTFRLSHCVGAVAEKLIAFAMNETSMVVNTISNLERILSGIYNESGVVT
jgi:hypothetical protein